MAPPPPDGSTGCVATIRRLMQGVGHTVPCSTSRQAALQARWVVYTVSLPIEARV
eukprot:COSAG01_NODE_50152_length_365_cov_3.842105_1_plen_54_part_01